MNENMPAINITNVKLADLYDKNFWERVVTMSNRVTNDFSYEDLWNSLDEETISKYFVDDEEFFYSWLDMLTEDQFHAYVDIIFTEGHLVLDEDQAYIELVDIITEKKPFEHNSGTVTVESFVDLFDEIKYHVRKYGATVTYQQNAVVIASNNPERLEQIKSDAIMSGCSINHKLVLEDLITQKDIVIYILSTRMSNQICLS